MNEKEGKSGLDTDKDSDWNFDQTEEDRICQLMSEFFYSKRDISELCWSSLGSTHKVILNLILLKKFGTSLDFDLSDPEAGVTFRQILDKKSKKRPEEKLKFVFKRCFKVLLEIFNKEQIESQKNLTSRQILDRFINFFYEEISVKHNIDLKEFYPPNRSRGKSVEKTKTLNLKYLAKLAMNPLILFSMVKYIDEQFKKDQFEETVQNMGSLVQKLRFMIGETLSGLDKENEKVLGGNDGDLKSVDQFDRNSVFWGSDSQHLKKFARFNEKLIFDKLKGRILKKKLNIPWNILEIESSLKFVSSKLSRIQQKIQSR